MSCKNFFRPILFFTLIFCLVPLILCSCQSQTVYYQAGRDVEPLQLGENTPVAGNACIKLEHNSSQVFVDRNGLIHEQVWVEAPVDTDSDGLRDLVHVEITRPGETENGLKAAAIINPTPYRIQNYDPEIFYDGLTEFEKQANEDNTETTYDDIRASVHTYQEIKDANFKPSWLPAMRQSDTVVGRKV